MCIRDRYLGLASVLCDNVDEDILKMHQVYIFDNLVDFHELFDQVGQLPFKAEPELTPVTATMSSTFDEHPLWTGFGAAMCIDGKIDADTDVVDNVAQFCHSNSEPNPWLAIDFGTRVKVQRVEIFNRNGCCGDRTRNVEVCKVHLSVFYFL